MRPRIAERWGGYAMAALILAPGLTVTGCDDEPEKPGVDLAVKDGGADASPAETGGGAEVSAETGAASCPMRPAETECDPVATEAVPLGAGRVRHCAFDVGSTNVRVVVTSMVPGDPDSIEGERVCKKAMRLREKTQDAATMMGKPLLEADMDALVAQLKMYGERCGQDQGKVMGAVATQWARNATNQDQIKTWFMAKMGLDLAVLTGDQEGSYAYAAGTHGKRDRLILDVGGGSFQLTHWASGEAKPTALSVPLGHDVGASKVWSKPEYDSFDPARQAYLTELRALIAAKPETSAALGQLKQLLDGGNLNKELLSLGDSGVILAVEGKLVDRQGHWVDEATYLQKVEERRRLLMAATPPGGTGPRKTLRIADVNTFLDTISGNRAWFQELRSECISKAYGAKVLGFLSLISQLAKDYGLADRVVFTSGEMAEGFILEKVAM